MASPQTLALSYFNSQPHKDSNPFIINCQKCNSSVILNNPDDIVYLYRLAQDAPLLYAKLALKENGLQDYVDAMNAIN